MSYEHRIVCTRCGNHQLASQDRQVLPTGWGTHANPVGDLEVYHTCQTCTKEHTFLVHNKLVMEQAFWDNLPGLKRS